MSSEFTCSNPSFPRVGSTSSTSQASNFEEPSRSRPDESGSNDSRVFSSERDASLAKLSSANLTALVLNKYGLNDLDGLDAGTEVKIYIKSSTSRDNVLGASYGEPYVISYVNNSNVPVTLESFNIPLQTFGGKWLQYKVELSSATKNLSPELYAVTITYTAATGSFFYSKKKS